MHRNSKEGLSKENSFEDSLKIFSTVKVNFMFEHVLQGILSAYFFKTKQIVFCHKYTVFFYQKSMKRILILEFASLP